MNKERPGRKVIALPAEFSCTMTLEEAEKRARLAKEIRGVSFSRGRKCGGRIVGRTTTTNLEAFDAFNERLYPTIKKKKASAR